jgi:hypothetical protein
MVWSNGKARRYFFRRLTGAFAFLRAFLAFGFFNGGGET